ncbi:hypothetical protein LCM10_05235 [Rossellomorea aquimaris]|uniref:hypothetical protein n=1 Tax=Rossellomorea aquimaris TaxID=189382 RepID=UPI001CD7EB27|nr:hypothetical protein [Rossellomorea aquimaris]MCA1054382.1 hypothetical protein [Rossellomorea aquimaris]
MFQFDMPLDAVSVGLDMLVWLVIGLAAYRYYRKKEVKPRVWKVLLVLVVGQFAFTINRDFAGTLVKFPVLPLGVWIMYGFLSRSEDRWEKYRPFAWLGFSSSFLFMIASLVWIPFYSTVYPASDPTTYIGNVSKASIVSIHPTGRDDRMLDRDGLKEQLPFMKQNEVDSDGWYEEMHNESDGERNKNERFPYVLQNVSSAWGSGGNPVVYVEKDGKGILVTTFREQYYYRCEESILEEGSE